MSRTGKRRFRPTLAQTIMSMIETQPEFSGVDGDKLRALADEYYEQEQGRFGQFLVSRGTITQGQLSMALAIQADVAGDHEKCMAHAKKAVDDMRSHIGDLFDEADSVSKAFEKVMTYDD